MTHTPECDLDDDCTCGVRENEEAIAFARQQMAEGKQLRVKMSVEQYEALMRLSPVERLAYAQRELLRLGRQREVKIDELSAKVEHRKARREKRKAAKRSSRRNRS